MKYQEIREKVLEGAVKCLERELIRGTSGNVSMLVPDEQVVIITPTGIPYDKLTPADLPVVSLQGKLLEGNLKPSSETPMHTAVYRARPNVRAVVHTHSLFTLVFSALNRELPPMTPSSSPYAPVPVAPFALPGSEDLANAAVKALGQDRLAILLQNHGMLAACPTMERALAAAEYVEECAQVAYYTLLANNMNPLPAEAVKELRERALKGLAV
ncbi:MAG: Ribulose-5-phosphate 4-epimerase and related epimerase and aldolase [Firmicutes bacterium]|nr:Ribulose-5-phosphate 4-epimerase and related epimerase and aldolase [Bacillota bacterium]